MQSIRQPGGYLVFILQLHGCARQLLDRPFAHLRSSAPHSHIAENWRALSRSVEGVGECQGVKLSIGFSVETRPILWRGVARSTESKSEVKSFGQPFARHETPAEGASEAGSHAEQLK